MAFSKPRPDALTGRRRLPVALGAIGALLLAGLGLAPSAVAAGGSISWLEADYNGTAIGDSGAGNANFDGQGATSCAT